MQSMAARYVVAGTLSCPIVNTACQYCMSVLTGSSDYPGRLFHYITLNGIME